MAEAHPLILTDIGLAKALQRQTADIQADITEFAVSDQKGALDPRRTTPNRIIYRGTPEVKAIIDDHTIQYTCRIPEGLEPFLIREIYLFLDDGTLFAIGQPRVYIGNQLIDYIAYTGQTEKPLTVAVAFTNATKILALKNVPMDEFEQSLVDLQTITSLGEDLLNVQRTLSILEGDYKKLKAKANKLFKEHEKRLSEEEKLSFDLQVALLEAVITLGDQINKLAKEIEALKNTIYGGV